MHKSYRSHVVLLLVFFFQNYLTFITGKPNLLDSITDNVALDCGSSAISTYSGGREWTGDIGSKFIASHQPKHISTVSNSTSLPSTVNYIPYLTARIFVSQFTYTIHISPGNKFIRLYFSPDKYGDYDRSKAYFTVTAGPFTLLRNFSASLAADSLGSKFLVKEFCVNVEEGHRVLNITFTPSPNTSDDAYAFINGIEIVSMPASLYYSAFGDKGVRLVGWNSRFPVRNNTALEMVHRLNVGGSSISPIEDSGKMFRRWFEDSNFFIPAGVNYIKSGAQIRYAGIAAYTAPEKVYQTARSTRMSRGGSKWHNQLTWRLPIDSGFKYLVRLHFCEVQPELKKGGYSGFHVSIRNKTVESFANVLAWSGGQGIPVYKDYVVMIPRVKSKGKTYLFIELRPIANSSAGYSDAILNGLELFKLNNSDANLAGPNPEVPFPHNHHKPCPPISKKKVEGSKSLMLLAIFGASLGVVTVFFLLGLTIFWSRKTAKSNKNQTSASLEELCRRFTLAEIRAATKNFNRNLVIGRGGCGLVYKGYIDAGLTPVAIKIFSPTSDQGNREFQTEISLLAKLRHPHLVSLIGYCDDEQVMIIVYDFMPHKTLRHHLYDTDSPPLSWKQRLEICIGTARGLLYLHEGAEHMVIHRDVKTSNILLDRDWVAKVSDFGLSRLGPTNLSRSHVTTNVRGTFGYMDPEYMLTNQLSVKSDVYGFGVVLFEVLCARPAVDTGLDDEQQCLSQWARQCYEDGSLEQIIERRLIGLIAPESLKVYGKIAYRCLSDERKKRPTMAKVLRALEKAMELQEIAEGGAHTVTIEDEVQLCGGGNPMLSRPRNSPGAAHSCPLFWTKSTSSKVLLRFFSDKTGLKWVKPSKPGGLPRLHVQVPDLSRCGPYTAPGNIIVETTNVKGQ